MNDQLTSDAAQEQAKYDRVWLEPKYRVECHGVRLLHRVLFDIGPAQPGTIQSFADFGCGTGRAAALLSSRGFPCIGVDISANSLDEVIGVPFIQAPLWDMPMFRVSHGICADVMEHIPPDRVAQVLGAICDRVDGKAYFKISTCPDEFGAMLGVGPLHLTVRPVDWWESVLSVFWSHVHIVDLNSHEFTALARGPVREPEARAIRGGVVVREVVR